MQKIIKYEVVSLELDSGFLSSKVDENDFTKLKRLLVALWVVVAIQE
jgi:hypothetical protein